MTDLHIAKTRKLLEKLLLARGPCGEEDEIREILMQLITPLADKCWIDKAGNVIEYVAGQSGSTEENSLRILVHMDELSMIVKKIYEDGTLQLRPLGQLYPAIIGQKPVEIFADEQIIAGVFSFGSMHITKESVPYWELDRENPNLSIDWNHASVFTNLSKTELENKGVHPGTRVVIAQQERKIWELADAWASYFMDNRAPLAAMIEILELLRQTPPLQDTYFVMTTNEETTADGACYASRTLPGCINIALEVAPIAPEFPVQFNDQSTVAFMDRFSLYDTKLARSLVASARQVGLQPQQVVWENLGSDSSIPKQYGLAPRAGCVGIPTRNTHGFEIIQPKAICNSAKLVHQFLTQSCYARGSYEEENSNRSARGYSGRKLSV